MSNSYPPYGQDPEQPPRPEQPNPYGGQQQPYGQQPYGAQPPYGYAQQPYVQDHQQATTVMILGILGLVLCQVLAPFAWVMGNRVVREIDASGGRIGGRSTAQAGRICGIIGSVFLILGLVVLIIYVIAIVALVGTSST